MSEIVQIAGFEIVDAKARKDINTLKNKKFKIPIKGIKEN